MITKNLCHLPQFLRRPSLYEPAGGWLTPRIYVDPKSKEMNPKTLTKEWRERDRADSMFRALVEQSLVGIYLFVEEHYVYVNQALADMVGYSVDEIVNQLPPLALIHPDDRPWVAEIIARRLQGLEGVAHYTFRGLRKDGSTILAEAFGRRIEYQGQPAILGTVVDLTERVWAEQAIRESHNRYLLLTETVQDIILSYDMQKRVVFINQAGLKMSGYSKEEIIGQPLERIIPPEYLADIQTRAQKRLSGDIERYLYELEFINAAGQRIPVEISSSPIMRDGQIVEVLIVARDITQRRQAEEALRRRMRQLMVLNQASQALTASLDLDRLLDKIISVTGEMLGVDYASILLMDGDQITHSVETLSSMPALTYRIREHGFTHWITHSRQPVVIDAIGPDGTVDLNLGEDAPRTINPEIVKVGIRSIAGLPLIVRDRLLGVLYLHSKRPGVFRNQLSMLTSLANQIAIAVENARLYTAERHRSAHQEALNTIIAAAAATYDLANFLEVALEHTLYALGLEAGVIWVGKDIAVRGWKDMEKIHRMGQQQHAGMKLPHVIAVDDWQCATAPHQPIAASMTGLGIRASITVPILSDEQPIGGLSVVDFQPRFWAAEEIALAEAVGRQLGGVAERLRLLAQVQEQAQQVRQIIDAVPEGVLLVGANGQVLSANPPAEKALSVLVDRADEVMAGRRSITRLGEHPLAELLTSPPIKGLWHTVEAKGSAFEIIARPITGEAASEQWVLVVKDVTQERKVRAQLAQQEQLATVGQLAAGIAHDFNNILSVIMLYTEMVARAEQFGERERERLRIVKQQADQATMLIQQILDFGRQAVLERRPLDMASLLEENVRLFRRMLPEHIEIIWEGNGEGCIVYADRTRMQQMLTNLIVNARDAMPDGGVLRIGLKRIYVAEGKSPLVPEMETGDWVQITIQDTGVGIPPTALTHIFEPFFTTKGPGEGSGLGLAQVHGIIGQHGGRIGVESRPGEGTTFTIYLPTMALQATTSSMNTHLATMPQGQGENVLVVEDNPSVRAVLSDGLTQLGYQVIEAQNGQEALDILQSYGNKIALVVSDVVMPGMGGIALFRAMQEQNYPQPVILMSGHPTSTEVDKLRAEGLTDWVSKPPKLAVLSQALHRALH